MVRIQLSVIFTSIRCLNNCTNLNLIHYCRICVTIFIIICFYWSSFIKDHKAEILDHTRLFACLLNETCVWVCCINIVCTMYMQLIYAVITMLHSLCTKIVRIDMKVYQSHYLWSLLILLDKEAIRFSKRSSANHLYGQKVQIARMFYCLECCALNFFLKV